MSEENQFEASPEEMAFVVKMRNATQALTPAEINLLRKRREGGQEAGSGAGDEPCLEDIRPGQSPEKLSEVLRHMRNLAAG